MAAEYHHAPKTFKGLICLGLACSEVLEPGLMPDDGGKIAQEIQKEPKVHGPFCRAVAAMAAGIYRSATGEREEGAFDYALAIEQLEEACNQGNPIMAWLHLLPLFEQRLNGWENFHRILLRVTPPSTISI